MRTAADNLLAGNEAPSEQMLSVGCSIKWKQGNTQIYNARCYRPCMETYRP
jgi:hypothetical protein